MNLNHQQCGRLMSLGFSQQEINDFCNTYTMLEEYNMNYNKKRVYTKELLIKELRAQPAYAERLMEIYKIVTGRKVITDENINRHFKKLNGDTYKVKLTDFPVGKVTSIPRKAIVLNIKDAPFDIWNYDKYKNATAIYDVISSTNTWLRIKSKKKPVIEYRGRMEVDGVVKLESGTTVNGECIVNINRNYASLCNHYVIIASLRQPQKHLGGYRLLANEGTYIYVYAKDIGTKYKITDNSHERIYDYGMNPTEIKARAEKIAAGVNKHFRCVKVDIMRPTDKFVPFNKPGSLAQYNTGDDID